MRVFFAKSAKTRGLSLFSLSQALNFSTVPFKGTVLGFNVVQPLLKGLYQNLTPDAYPSLRVFADLGKKTRTLPGRKKKATSSGKYCAVLLQFLAP